MMLKHAFDDVEQLSRHLHFLDDSPMMFVRNPGISLRPGALLLELELTDQGAALMVRANVVADATRPARGTWMQLDSRFGRRLVNRLPFGARHDRRICSNKPVQLISENSDLAVQLLDVGTGGLRVRRFLAVGEVYAVRLMGAPRTECDLGVAEVVRVDSNESALRFVQPRNHELSTLIRNVARSWSHAPRIEHSPSCCGDGVPAALRAVGRRRAGD